MLTFFTIPKPFVGIDGIHQYNAIRSWQRSVPGCEIFLCGDDPGFIRVAKELDVQIMAGIETSEHGTPLLSSVFQKMNQLAANSILSFVNTDIIFLPGLSQSIGRIRFKQFLALGRRTNIDLQEEVDYSDLGWDLYLKEKSKTEGELFTIYGIDYFIFPINTGLQNMPPFIVGRPLWDNWFIFNARKQGIPIVDITRVNLAIHQNHDYIHIPHWYGRSWLGPEAEQNKQLYHSLIEYKKHYCNARDATHILTDKWLIPAFKLGFLYNRLQTNAMFIPVLRPLAWIFRWFRQRFEEVKYYAKKLISILIGNLSNFL